MRKYNIWIIDDDKIRIKQYKDFLKEEKLLSKFEIRTFDVLVNAHNEEGTPDFILIDTTSIMGGITLYGCFDTAISSCIYLAKKHTSSVFCIQSAVKSWAKDIIDEMTQQLSNEVVCESIEASGEDFICWIKKWLKIFEGKMK